MRGNLLFAILVLSVFVGCSESKNEILSLSGEWQFSTEGDSLWKQGFIPGTVQTDLLKLGEIPDPFVGNNEDSIQWISERNWLYQKLFQLDPEVVKKDKHYLQFKGLDTYADVWLNDSLILEANNAFRRWEVDVTDIISAENRLKIRFKSTDSIEVAETAKLPYELPEAPRVFTRKPQFQYGWDWGPTIKTMGVFRDIELVSFDDVRITDFHIQLDTIIEDREAKLTAHLELEVFRPAKITLSLNSGNDFNYEHKIDVSPINTNYTIPIVIEDPKLWWTHNLGEPHLYPFNLEVKQGGDVLEAYEKNVGIRTIELVTEKDDNGESFYIKLNGVPVYMKGANYIPPNIFLSEIDANKYKELIDQVVDANMNMIRIWGGGVYEDDVLYDLCDEAGVLIWQDFMFACAMYPGDPQFIENVKQEAIDNVKRLRQHPSIALWCGNNENSEGWHRWGWKDGKTEEEKQEIWEGYYAVFNHVLPGVVDSIHKGASYWETSPKYGRGDSRYEFEGDAHDWWVWHDGYPFEHFQERVPRFMSEFGFQSFPSYEAIQYFTETDSIDIDHASFETHQKHPRGFSLIREYMERDYPVPDNPEDYVYVSQLLQARGITMGIRAQRAAKPYNMGSLYWQLNDCWPVVSWSAVDGLGNPKALHYKAKRAFENVMIHVEEKEDSLAIRIINDSFNSYRGQLNILLMDFEGNLLLSEPLLIDFPGSSNTIVHELKLPEFEAKETLLSVFFDDHNYIHYFARPKDLDLKNVEPELEIEAFDGGYELTFKTTTLVKDLFVYTSAEGYWSDNYIDLLPGKPVSILFFTDSTNQPEFQFKTLNQIIDP